MDIKPSIQLTDAVIFQKNAHREVLRDVNFYAYPGELVYLVGRVGSGKSSLLKTLYGDLPLQICRGMVACYLLHTLSRKKVPSLRRKLGIVFQDATLLNDSTVYQNLDFVLRATDWRDKEAIHHRIQAVMGMTDTTHKTHSYPHPLSGGKRQRASIEEALRNDPQIVMADELTADPDPR